MQLYNNTNEFHEVQNRQNTTTTKENLTDPKISQKNHNINLLITSNIFTHIYTSVEQSIPLTGCFGELGIDAVYKMSLSFVGGTQHKKGCFLW